MASFQKSSTGFHYRGFKQLNAMKKLFIYGFIIVTVFTVVFLFNIPAFGQQNILTLQEAIQQALENNALIKQRDYAFKAANYNVAEQQSNYYPNLLFRTNVSHANEAPRIPVEFKTDTVLARQGTQNTFIARFELSQLVYDFGKTKHGIKAARYGASAKNDELRRQKHQITVEVKRQYYRSLAYQNVDSIYQSIIPLNQDLRTINEQKLKNGVALSTDVLRSQSDLQNALANLTMAKNEINKSHDQLVMLTGLTTDNFRTTGTLPGVPGYFSKIDKRQLYERLLIAALKNRQDIRQAEFMSKQQDELSRVYATQNYPTLMLQSDFSYFGPDAFGYYSNLSSRGLKNYNWRVGIGFSFNLFDGLRARSQKQQSLNLKKQFEEQAMQLRLQISARIKSTLSDLQNIQMLVRSNKAVLEQTLANLKIVEASYKNGAVPEINLIQARIPVAEARATLVKNQYEMIQSLLVLEETVGTDLMNNKTILK